MINGEIVKLFENRWRNAIDSLSISDLCSQPVEETLYKYVSEKGLELYYYAKDTLYNSGIVQIDKFDKLLRPYLLRICCPVDGVYEARNGEIYDNTDLIFSIALYETQLFLKSVILSEVPIYNIFNNMVKNIKCNYTGISTYTNFILVNYRTLSFEFAKEETVSRFFDFSTCHGRDLIERGLDLYEIFMDDDDYSNDQITVYAERRKKAKKEVEKYIDAKCPSLTKNIKHEYSSNDASELYNYNNILEKAVNEEALKRQYNLNDKNDHVQTEWKIEDVRNNDTFNKFYIKVCSNIYTDGYIENYVSSLIRQDITFINMKMDPSLQMEKVQPVFMDSLECELYDMNGKYKDKIDMLSVICSIAAYETHKANANDNNYDNPINFILMYTKDMLNYFNTVSKLIQPYRPCSDNVPYLLSKLYGSFLTIYKHKKEKEDDSSNVMKKWISTIMSSDDYADAVANNKSFVEVKLPIKEMHEWVNAIDNHKDFKSYAILKINLKNQTVTVYIQFQEKSN